MTTVLCPKRSSSSTVSPDDMEYASEFELAINTAEKKPQRRWLKSPRVRAITTTPGAASEGCEWIEKSHSLLRRVAELPDNWDAAGSPRPGRDIVVAVVRLLNRLQASSLGAIPVPFVCPVAGGGIQFEWSSSTRHLEIEFIDPSNVAFLKEEATPGGKESVESGEYSLADIESTRQLLEWFATV